MKPFNPRRWIVGAAAVAVVGCRSVEPSAARPATVIPASVQRVPDGVRQVQHTAPAPAECVIDLESALRLAGAGNPTVNLAREAVREAEADHQAARALLLPSLNVGGNFRLHRGTLQGSTGLIRTLDSQSLFVGGGAQAVGTGPPVQPGVRLFAHLGDALYEPLAARQVVSARRSDAQATQNDILRDAAAAYLELVGAEERARVLRKGEADLGEVVKLTAASAKAGQGREADSNRAQANADLFRGERLRAEEERAVAAARLCRLLSLDPSVELHTPAGAVVPLRVFPDAGDLAPLIETALASRPEVAARAAEVGAAQVRRRQEAVRPWLPTVSVGYSYGAFGGGSNQVASDFGPLNGRSDFDVTAVWTVDGLGFGNRARTRRAGAVLSQAVAGLEGAKAEVSRQVGEAHAEVQAAARQIGVAAAAVEAAEEGYRLEMERIRQPPGRPIETLDSVRQLLDARLEAVRAVVAYNTAQFRLLAAVGGTPLPVRGQPAGTSGTGLSSVPPSGSGLARTSSE